MGEEEKVALARATRVLISDNCIYRILINNNIIIMMHNLEPKYINNVLSYYEQSPPSPIVVS